MSDVVRLGPQKINRFPEPFPGLVEELEKLLAEAKAGTLRAAAWAVVRTDGIAPDAEVATGWARAGGTSFALSAAIARLTHRWDRHEHRAADEP